jgi:arsenite-transporting ATPase
MEFPSQAMTNQLLVINGVFCATDRNDPLAAAFERRGAEALSHIPEEVASLPRAEIPLLGGNIVGLDALRSLFSPLQRADAGTPGPAALPQDISYLADLVDELSRSDHGLIMVMGKGGVGKTTVAAAVAVSLAKRGVPLHLTTTDPAQHVWETLRSEMPGLRVSYIDPKQEARQYRERMLESARATLSAEKLALFEEELKSPCYEEVAVFQAFSRIVMGARKELVVVDTAPTGHTLLLLDTAGTYHRQVTQQAVAGAGRIRTPLMMLQDPEYTKVLIVALPETTPVLEASMLQDDLRRAQIEPFAWIINASLAAAQPRDPVLRARAAAEIPLIHKVKEQLAQRVVLIPFQAEEPVGVECLNSLAAGVRRASMAKAMRQEKAQR